jgi:hypothetical protein
MEKPIDRKNIEHCPENPAVSYEGKRLKKEFLGKDLFCWKTKV